MVILTDHAARERDDLAAMAAPTTDGDHCVDVVQDLRNKLRAAQNRERDLHQHLLFHLQGRRVDIMRLCVYDPQLTVISILVCSSVPLRVQ